MRISQLIEELQKIQANHGNLEAVLDDPVNKKQACNSIDCVLVENKLQRKDKELVVVISDGGKP